jgi:hypothetical protein
MYDAGALAVFQHEVCSDIKEFASRRFHYYGCRHGLRLAREEVHNTNNAMRLHAVLMSLRKPRPPLVGLDGIPTFEWGSG